MKTLFCLPESHSQHIKDSLLLGLEYLTGLAVWANLFNFGRFSFQPCDWLDQKAYINVLTESLNRFILPLHTTLPLKTQRFLAIPEVNLFPDFLLLKWLSPEQFVLFNALLMYSLCFGGCLLLKKRLKLSQAAFVPLLLAFTLNGHLIAHCLVGHPWWGLFWLPYFFYALTGMLQKEKKQVALMALSLGAMALTGSFHCFSWCVLFVLCTAIVDKPRRWQYLQSLLLAALLSAGRFAPAAISLKATWFEGGYPDPLTLIQGLVWPGSPLTAGYFPWERENFIGFCGLAFIIYFAALRPEEDYAPMEKAWWPALVIMTVFSYASWYYPIYWSNIPLLSAERVTTRFLLMPVLALFVAASVRLQSWLEKNLHRTRLLWLVPLSVTVFFLELLNNSTFWTVTQISACGSNKLAHVGGAGPIANIEDPIYTGLLAGGWLVSMITFTTILCTMQLFKGQLFKGQLSKIQLFKAP